MAGHSFPLRKRNGEKCTDNGGVNCARFASQQPITFDCGSGCLYLGIIRMIAPRTARRPAEGDDVSHSYVDPSGRLRREGGTDVLSVVHPLLLIRRRCVDLLKVATCLCRG